LRLDGNTVAAQLVFKWPAQQFATWLNDERNCRDPVKTLRRHAPLPGDPIDCQNRQVGNLSGGTIDGACDFKPAANDDSVPCSPNDNWLFQCDGAGWIPDSPLPTYLA